MHALISVVKAVTTWDMVYCLEECRQACGGLGISSYSRIPNMIKDLNVMVTWEGDNNVLLQQTAKFLLSEYAQVAQGNQSKYPTLDFLRLEPVEAIEFEDEEELDDLEFLETILKMRLLKVIQEGAAKFMIEKAQTEINFDAWNRSVPFNLNQMATSYGQLFLFQSAKKQIVQCPNEANKDFLTKLLQISTLNRVRENTQ